MTPKLLRCAIYTRKSSEEGLEQGFNSLHAQREACEAYVLSQAGEGWSALATLYDDGGYSGGSIDRPGLRSLLGDVEGGKIDVVVVYKVDRLTRSLADFAKIVDAFDAKGVSFVSVTQAFNTTTSMGRLTLNVLLSFAQFEREVTGERIRDKIAASKAKGMWMGGGCPMGYDPPTAPLSRALVVNEPEAEVVRTIFAKYLELGTVRAVQQWLKQEDIRSKEWVSASGRSHGGRHFARGALFHLLRNPVYVGLVPHKGKVHQGLHAPIVDQGVYEEVGRRLAAQATRHRTPSAKRRSMLLRGLIFDDEGTPMTPTYTAGKKGQTYRYYVSTSLHTGEAPPSSDAIRRVSAPRIEDVVVGCIERLSEGASVGVSAALVRLEVHRRSIQLVLRRRALFKRMSDVDGQDEALRTRLQVGERLAAEAGQPDHIRVSLPVRLQNGSGRTWLTDESGGVASTTRVVDHTLIKGLRAAHGQIATHGGIPLGRLETLNLQGAPASPYDRNLCRLAFLAPDIQAQILEGKQHPALTLTRLLTGDIPPSWEDQRRLFEVPC